MDLMTIKVMPLKAMASLASGSVKSTFFHFSGACGAPWATLTGSPTTAGTARATACAGPTDGRAGVARPPGNGSSIAGGISCIGGSGCWTAGSATARGGRAESGGCKPAARKVLNPALKPSVGSPVGGIDTTTITAGAAVACAPRGGGSCHGSTGAGTAGAAGASSASADMAAEGHSTASLRQCHTLQRKPRQAQLQGEQHAPATAPTRPP
mmetsp:Transcript_134261/g.374219  ORF Transcript_134261/g.374219 Transcript_134261/m.374219 type:complete len:211 (+) Transcript_134261:641-1273(+)